MGLGIPSGAVRRLPASGFGPVLQDAHAPMSIEASCLCCSCQSCKAQQLIQSQLGACMQVPVGTLTQPLLPVPEATTLPDDAGGVAWGVLVSRPSSVPTLLSTRL